MAIARILVVDDDPVNRTLVRALLSQQGYEVAQAASGQEGLDEVARNPPDLVLLDLLMPGMDGDAVLSQLKAEPATRLIPVVMLTSDEEPLRKVRAVEIGADDYLRKPFNHGELTARVASLIRLKRYTDDLEHASKVLESVALVVEGRDRYTGNHCKRLGEYAVRVGREMGVQDEDLKTLQLGAVFHDLGKIAISDVILNKPGKLSPEEFETMKLHPVRGAELCREMRTFGKVLPLIRNHHEKLDGSGYPDKLGGKDLPLLVRITSVVDVFDALHTKRSYKESLPNGECFRILREEVARGWWDRDVVETLARLEEDRVRSRK